MVLPEAYIVAIVCEVKVTASCPAAALSSAIGHIEGSKSLLEVKAEVRQGFW